MSLWVSQFASVPLVQLRRDGWGGDGGQMDVGTTSTERTSHHETAERTSSQTGQPKRPGSLVLKREQEQLCSLLM